jgi:hypothetical protein
MGTLKLHCPWFLAWASSEGGQNGKNVGFEFILQSFAQVFLYTFPAIYPIPSSTPTKQFS